MSKLLKMTARVRVVPGGTWAGKTYDIIAHEISYLAAYGGKKCTVVAETIPALKDGALKDFKEIMMDLGRWVPERFHGGDRIYTFHNGSQIQFTSFESEGKARQSGKRHRLFVNEVNTINKDIVDALMIRTEDVIWLDYNPTARFWVNDELEDKAEWCTLTYRDNDALPATIYKELMERRERAKTSEHWANWCRVYLDGEIGSIEGVCLTDWKEIDKLPTYIDENGEEQKEYRLLGYGLDFGYSNDPTALVALYKWNDAYIFEEIIYQKGLLNKEIADIIKARCEKEKIWADSAEPKSIQELKNYGIKVVPAVKGADSIRYGIELLNQNKVYFLRSSKNLIRDAQNYKWAKNRAGEILPKPEDAFNDTIDAARYVLTGELGNPHLGVYHFH